MNVTVEGLKAHLNLDNHDDDLLLIGKIAAASAWVTSYCGLSSMPDDMPADISEAIFQLAAHFYAHRGDGAEFVPVPAVVKSLVAPHYRWAA